MNANLRTILAGGVAALGPALVCLAQYPVQNGHALDRNLQLGSGGVNAPRQPNTAGQYGNALVTGNTGGLSSFHGNVGYRAPGEFTGGIPAGETDQFTFLRQSLPQVAPPPGQQGFLPQQVAPGILFRPGAGVTTGQVSGEAQPYNVIGVPTFRSDVNAFIAPEVSRDGRLEAGPTPLLTAPSTLAVTRDHLGNLLQVTASPLNGVQTMNLGTPLNVEQAETPAGPAPAGAPGRNPPGTRGTPTPPGVQPAAPTTGQAPEGAEQGEVNAQVKGRLNDQLPPTLIIAQQLGEVQPMQGRRPGAPLRADVLERQVLHPQGWATAQPGQDVYADLLRRINAQARPAGATGEAGGNQPPQGPPPDQLAQPAPKPQGVPGAQPAGPPADRLGAPAPAAPGAPGAGPAQPPKTQVQRIAEQFEQAQRQPGLAQRQQEQSRQQMQELLGKLSYNLPPLGTLVGSAQTPYNAALAQAEQQMGKGQYFAAEESYVRAMATQPRHPIAQAGRVNAQLGAGLYVAAASNLRQLYLAYPQLIAARYTAPVLPEPARMARITQELQAAQKQNPSEDSALLLGYVGWQRNDLGLVRDSLNTMASQNPQDPLVPVLRRIWLSNEARARPATDTPAR